MKDSAGTWYVFRKPFTTENGTSIPSGTPLYQLTSPLVVWGAWDAANKKYLTIINRPDAPNEINRRQPGTLVKFQTK